MSMSLAEKRTFDQHNAETLAEHIGQILDSGAVAVMLSIGHRTGLLDLMARLPPSPSHRIASEAGLSERYVREWLAAMTTGRIVRYDPVRRTYALPPEHAACLTRGGALGNFAVYAQYVTLMGQVQAVLAHHLVKVREGRLRADRAACAPPHVRSRIDHQQSRQGRGLETEQTRTSKTRRLQRGLVRSTPRPYQRPCIARRTRFKGMLHAPTPPPLHRPSLLALHARLELAELLPGPSAVPE
jgi:hypothetical protein